MISKEKGVLKMVERRKTINKILEYNIKHNHTYLLKKVTGSIPKIYDGEDNMKPWTEEDFERFKDEVCQSEYRNECVTCDRSNESILHCFDCSDE